jgi:hypothetical protein
MAANYRFRPDYSSELYGILAVCGEANRDFCLMLDAVRAKSSAG